MDSSAIAYRMLTFGECICSGQTKSILFPNTRDYSKLTFSSIYSSRKQNLCTFLNFIYDFFHEKRRYRHTRVEATKVYNEIISHKSHVHMNGTKMHFANSTL